MLKWLMILIFYSGLALSVEQYPFSNPSSYQRFSSLTQQFRCLVCQNEDLAASTAKLAKDLRTLIYQQIQQGKTDQQIKAYLVSRYGDFILFKPPLERSTVLLWLGPGLFLILGLILVICIVRRSRGHYEAA